MSLSYMYFDESIRDRGRFIAGALVVSEVDLTTTVHERWRALGFDPAQFEYKSRGDKVGLDARMLRDEVHAFLEWAQVGVVICPLEDRGSLGVHAISLATQLATTGCIGSGAHVLYLDQGIRVASRDLARAETFDIQVCVEQDSRVVGGLQIADHVSHLLGTLLLERMGLVTKMVRAGEFSAYDPDTELELGYELWSSLRHSIICAPAEVSGIDPDDWFAMRPVDGFGLYVAPSCGAELRAAALDRFGENYLGCIL